MSTVAQLDIESAKVAAGERVTLPLNVKNIGEVVEDYRVEIVGTPAGWTTVDPPAFTLYPGTAQVATLDVHPPRTPDVPAGEVRFGVHVLPTEHPHEAVVPEAVIEVLPYLDTVAELVPHTTHGRSGGKHQIAIDNGGNVPVTVQFRPAADNDAIDVTTDPQSLVIEPGHAAFTDVRVKPTRRLWRGVPITYPFTVTVVPEGSPEAPLVGAHVQDPILPKWFFKALLGLLALLAALLLFWFLLLKPTIESAAKEAVADPVKSAAAQAAAAQQAANQAQQGGTKAADAATNAQAAASAAAGPPPPKVVTGPSSQRLEVLSNPGGAPQTATFTVPAGQSLAITDFVIENTRGDAGLLTVKIGDQVVFAQALESFRTTDYHFVTPFVAGEGVAVRLQVKCTTTGTPSGQPPGSQCTNALTFGGSLTRPAS
ncbi:MAG: hypothetical protein V9G08_12655 [Dermatophilaceae bacterium]